MSSDFGTRIPKLLIAIDLEMTEHVPIVVVQEAKSRTGIEQFIHGIVASENKEE